MDAEKKPEYQRAVMGAMMITGGTASGLIGYVYGGLLGDLLMASGAMSVVMGLWWGEPWRTWPLSLKSLGSYTAMKLRRGEAKDNEFW